MSLPEFEQVFEIYDKDHDGKVDKTLLYEVIQALGKAPSMSQRKELEDEIPGAVFDVNQLKNAFRKSSVKTPREMENDMLNCFRALDKEGNGTIHESELRQILTTLGDYLSASEVEALLKEVPISRDGFIEYDKFVDKLINDSPTD